MKRTILIAAGLAALAVFILYWRVIIFLSMTVLVAGPLALLCVLAAALLAAVFWARRRSAPRRDSN